MICLHFQVGNKNVHTSIKEHLNVKKNKREKQGRKKEKRLVGLGFEPATSGLKITHASTMPRRRRCNHVRRMRLYTDLQYKSRNRQHDFLVGYFFLDT
jgi:hypothetical protein